MSLIDNKLNEKTGLFNSKLKEAFLMDWCKTNKDSDEMKKSAEELYRKILQKASKYESDLNKDLFEFNYDELSGLLGLYRASSMKSITTVFTAIKRYIKWTIISKNAGDIIPYIDNFKKKDLEKYLFIQDKFVTKEELFEDILPTADNDQDVVILALLFDLVKGQATCEIRNLKKSDIDFENQIAKIRNEENDTYREVKLSKETIELIKRANKQSDYTRELKKDVKELDSQTSLTYELADTDYILRGVERKVGKGTATKENSPISYQVADTRVKRVVMKAGRPHITTLTIYQSGVLWRLYELEKEKGELTVEDYKTIWAESGNDEQSYHHITDIYRIQYKPYVESKEEERQLKS